MLQLWRQEGSSKYKVFDTNGKGNGHRVLDETQSLVGVGKEGWDWILREVSMSGSTGCWQPINMKAVDMLSNVPGYDMETAPRTAHSQRAP